MPLLFINFVICNYYYYLQGIMLNKMDISEGPVQAKVAKDSTLQIRAVTYKIQVAIFELMSFINPLVTFTGDYGPALLRFLKRETLRALSVVIMIKKLHKVMTF
jgi:hypothetical protein